MNAPIKHKKCVICKTPFPLFNSLAKVCSPKCAIEWVNKETIRREASHKRILRAEMKEARERIKTKSEWAREAQTVFNRYIRLRDGKHCISCGTSNPNIQYAAGHYRTVGACPELRYEPKNVHAQCNKHCNLMLSGNILAYRAALIQKHGIDFVNWLDGPHEPKKYTIDDLKAIKLKYAKLCKEMT